MTMQYGISKTVGLPYGKAVERISVFSFFKLPL
jgi:hypothetical protein